MSAQKNKPCGAVRPPQGSEIQFQTQHTPKSVATPKGRIIGPNTITAFSLKSNDECFACGNIATGRFNYAFPDKDPKILFPFGLCALHCGGLFSGSAGESVGSEFNRKLEARIRGCARRFVTGHFHGKASGGFHWQGTVA